MPTEITFRNALCLAFLKIRPQRRVFPFDLFFFQMTVEQEQAPAQYGVSVLVRQNLVFRQITRTRQNGPKRREGQFTPLDFFCRQYKVPVIPRRQATLDREEIAQDRRVHLFKPLFHGVPGPLWVAAQRLHGHHALQLRPFQRPAVGKPNLVPGSRRLLAKPHHGGRHQCVGKLHVVRIETMNLQQRHLVEKIALDRNAIVYVHEFARYQPAGQTSCYHPRMAQTKEIAIQPGQTVHFHAARRIRTYFQALFFSSPNMMMPHVRRITDQQIEPVEIRRRLRLREVLQAHIQAGFPPQVGRRHPIVRVDLVA